MGFEEFWREYPKRRGSTSKSLARTKFDRAIKSGATAEEIIWGAKKYAEAMRSMSKDGTEFVAMAATWLNQERWKDYGEKPQEQIIVHQNFYAAFASPQLEAWNEYERKNRRSTPRDRNGGWYFPSEWPPELS